MPERRGCGVRTVRRGSLLSLGALLILLLAAAVSAQGTQAGQASAARAGAVPATVFRLAQQEPPDPFDPATLGDNRSIELAQNVFDSLTKTNEKTLSIVPALAASYKVSPNGKVYTFLLRKGITYQNGRAMSAQDIVYTINRALNPKVKSQYAFFSESDQGSGCRRFR